MFFCRLGPIIYFWIHHKVASLPWWVLLWMCYSTVSRSISRIKTIPCALHFQPGDVWSRVKPHSSALSLSFSENTAWYFDKSVCGRSDPIMAWLLPSLQLGQLTSCPLLYEFHPFSGLGSALWPIGRTYGLLLTVKPLGGISGVSKELRFFMSQYRKN